MSMKRTIPFLFVLSLFTFAPLVFAETQVTPPNANTTQTQVTPSPANTSANNSASNGVLTNPLNASNLQDFVGQILDFLITIGSLVIVFMIVFVGFKFVIAQGQPSAIQEARTMLVWTLIGAAVLLGAKTISLALQSTVQAITN